MSNSSTTGDIIADRILESLNLTANYVDPFDRFRDADGTTWMDLGVATGLQSPVSFRNEQELTRARECCRLLAEVNPFAIGAHECLTNYIAGTGHVYKAVKRKGVECDDSLAGTVQRAIDDELRANRWPERQQEMVRRYDRDGEIFLRFFDSQDGCTLVRFVEPDQVHSPQGNSDPDHAFGIHTDADDVETVLGYWIDGEEIPAEHIQHRKANVDANVRRGRPTFWGTRELLNEAVKVLRNIGKTSKIQTAIALIRRHMNASKAGLTTRRAGEADVTTTNQATGQTKYYRDDGDPRIVDAPSGTEYDFPAAGLNVERYVSGVAGILRSIAARLQLPEFMFTADASNANYSSTLVAEGPAVKQFQRRQQTMIVYDLEVIWRFVRNAREKYKLPDNVEELIEIQAEPPAVTSRDRQKDATTDDIEQAAGILSPQTRAQRSGLDYDQEQRNIAEHNRLHPQPTPGLLTDPRQPIVDPLAAANIQAREQAWRGYPL